MISRSSPVTFEDKTHPIAHRSHLWDSNTRYSGSKLPTWIVGREECDGLSSTFLSPVAYSDQDFTTVS